MTAVNVVDQQLIVHLYARAEGQQAEEALRSYREIWTRCRYMLGMTEPVTTTGLPDHLPSSIQDLPSHAHMTVPEIALAVQQHPDRHAQAVLRLHHDVLTMSVALARPQAPDVQLYGSEVARWWGEATLLWEAAAGVQPELLGSAQLYSAHLNIDEPMAEAAAYLRVLLPSGPTADGWSANGVTLPEGPTAWELSPRDDARRDRRLLVCAHGHGDRALSRWTWSDGGPTIPLLARYLLHAAKMRHALRVWQRFQRSAGNGVGSHEFADASSLYNHPDRRQIEAAAMSLMDLKRLRQSVDIAMDNMALALRTGNVDGQLGGMFADDRSLGQWLHSRLGDEISAMGIDLDSVQQLATQRPLRQPGSGVPPAAAVAARAPSADETSRRVFVVHGRDEQIRERLFNFLRALDLQPMEWEQLIRAGEHPTPYLGDVVADGIARCRATVVLMTPDDQVALHPELRLPGDAASDVALGMQARPNVLIELGMALGVHPDRTIILVAGDLRPIADLGGRNFIRLGPSVECQKKIISRLEAAGCAVNEQGADWTRIRFAELAAYTRQPVVIDPS